MAFRIGFKASPGGRVATIKVCLWSTPVFKKQNKKCNAHVPGLIFPSPVPNNSSMSNLAIQNESTDAEVLAPGTTRTLLEIVPMHVRVEMEKLSAEDLNKSEIELARELDPTPFANQIRMNFWAEYVRAQRRKTEMRMINVYDGVCTKSSFHDNIVKSHRNLLWVVTPPADLMASSRDAFWLAMRFMRKIFEDMPLFTKEKLDPHGISQGLRAFEILKDIVHGATIQRIETKSLNVNVNTDADTSGMTHEEIKKQLKEYETPVVEVTDVENES